MLIYTVHSRSLSLALTLTHTHTHTHCHEMSGLRWMSSGKAEFIKEYSQGNRGIDTNEYAYELKNRVLDEPD